MRPTIDMLGVVSQKNFNEIKSCGKSIGAVSIRKPDDEGKYWIMGNWVRDGNYFNDWKVMATLLEENRDISHEFVENFTFPKQDKKFRIPNKAFKTKIGYYRWLEKNKKSIFRGNSKTVKYRGVEYIYLGTTPITGIPIYLVKENGKADIKSSGFIHRLFIDLDPSPDTEIKFRHSGEVGN